MSVELLQFTVYKVKWARYSDFPVLPVVKTQRTPLCDRGDVNNQLQGAISKSQFDFLTFFFVGEMGFHSV